MELKIDGFNHLDSLPSIPSQILKALDGIEKISAMDYNIVQMIQYDAPIALGVLRLSNAPLYGYPSEILSLQQAAGLLGLGAIKNVILTTPVFERFRDYHEADLEFDFTQLWLHTAVTASVAGGLGALIDDVESDVCFTAGLLQDCGLIALAMNFPHSMNAILHRQAAEKISLLQAEQEEIGFTHVEIGAQIMESWGIPAELFEAVKDGFDADKGNPATKLSAVISLAKRLARNWDYGDGTQNGVSLPVEPLLDLIQVSAKKLSEWEPRLKDYAVYAARVVEG